MFDLVLVFMRDARADMFVERSLVSQQFTPLLSTDYILVMCHRHLPALSVKDSLYNFESISGKLTEFVTVIPIGSNWEM